MNLKRLTSVILTLAFCLAALCAAQAEVKAVPTEQNGKVKQIEWIDEATFTFYVLCNYEELSSLLNDLLDQREKVLNV